MANTTILENFSAEEFLRDYSTTGYTFDATFHCIPLISADEKLTKKIYSNPETEEIIKNLHEIVKNFYRYFNLFGINCSMYLNSVHIGFTINDRTKPYETTLLFDTTNLPDVYKYIYETIKSNLHDCGTLHVYKHDVILEKTKY